MTRNDWYNAGDQIKKLVQDAVDSGDFSQLGSTITNVVNDIYQYTNREAADRIRKNMQQKEQEQHKDREPDRAQRRRENTVHVHIDRMKYPGMRVPGEITGNVMKWVGYGLCGMFGLAFSIYLIVALSLGLSRMWVAVLFALFFGCSFLLADEGSDRVKLAKRFRRYCDIMGERTYCLIEELASATGKSHKYVRKDLKKMIRRGFFKEGYLDRKETLLITDGETYRQYLTAQEAYEIRAAEQKNQKSDGKKESAQAASGSADTKLDPGCREIIEEGRRYIAHIRACNDRIEGMEFSRKLDRLELVISRIFYKVEKHPDSADDLKKMMSYYLPTTKKLLDAYCELDEQPIAGDNIEHTKREIEEALDTINAAFEKLLDSFFEETAWDISSDITVLHNMLAQEGLTESGFAQK